MKILKYIVLALVAAIALVFLIGFLLPREHTAAVRAMYHARPERVYAAIADVEAGPAWRTGMKKVEVLARDPLRWRETAEWGVITFVRDEAVPNQKIVTRIADADQGFGGTWIYVLSQPAHGAGTTLTITENGTVSNPLFRFMSRFVFGHYTSLEAYVEDLGKHLGETVTPERIE